jgi:hypothetical protein
MTRMVRRVGRVVATLALVASTSAADAQEWSFGLSGFLFDPPDDSPYFSPIFDADRGALHLEARHNYENLETASAFAGWNLETGEEVVFDVTPMFGFVFGETDGAAPGLELGVTWRALEFYSESEYVFDFASSDDSFFYAWIQTTGALTDWLSAGVVAQKTETYQTGLEIQRGLMVDVTYDAWSLGSYWFNPDRSEDDLFVFSLGYEF